ncbi:MAG: DNA-3-methyladenine glycosylase 2 family protein [Cytophagaceae bacterium]|nr:DNA-3-methyladenine glycosylase 2 family protein [Gemmatimonadaceae bacterium]
MHRKAIRHLRENDPVLGAVIDRIGPCRLKPQTDLSHFEAVARAIVYQQLSGKAAGTIYGRFAGLFPSGRPSADHLLALEDDALRAAGLSRPKVKYLRDLASRVASNDLPIDGLHELADEEIVGHLTKVKGVGLWTAQMFLLFRLGRPDVLPDLDLGIQKAVRLAYRLRKRPTPERVRKIGARWAPFRSVATWYLWRSID